MLVQSPRFSSHIYPTLYCTRPAFAIARIRLSPLQCDSNAVYKWHPSRGVLTVHATRDIPTGEEITFNYGFDSMFATRAERQQRLRDTFGFVCTCEKCSLKGDALRESDRRNASLSDRQLLMELEAWGRIDELLRMDAAVALGRLEERFELIQAECSGVMHGVEHFLQCWVEWCERSSRLLVEASTAADAAEQCDEKAAAYMKGAHRWAQLAHDVTRTIAGEDAPAHQVWADAP